MAKGKFDLNDLRMQLKQMQNMGGLGALAGMMPGMKKAKAAMADSGVDDNYLNRLDAIIGSMTAKERGNPALMNAKRKKRVAAGSGTTVQDVNKLMKMHQEMSRAMKQIKKMGGLKGLAAMFGGGGGMGGGAAAGMGGGMPSLPGMGAPAEWAAGTQHPARPRKFAQQEEISFSNFNRITRITKGKYHGNCTSSFPWRRQEAPLLPHRGRRQPPRP